jgi:hypothetical protein
MAAPVAARIAGTELADPLRSYGHLVIRAARFAWGNLDGRAVINRTTGLPIGFSWEHGLKQAVASGTAPELLLLIPALPALLVGARYVGALPDPQRRPHARQLLAFAAVAEVVGRPVDIRLIVREDRLGQCFFDRILLCGKSALRRQEGRGARGYVPGANGDRSRAMRAVLTPACGFADGGDTSASDEEDRGRADVPAATSAAADETTANFGQFTSDARPSWQTSPQDDRSSQVSGVATADAEQESGPRVFSPTERAVAAQRFTELDAAADRIEQHIDETARDAAIPTVAAGSEIAAPDATDFPLNHTPDQANPTLAAIDVPAAGASVPRDDAAGSGRAAVNDLYSLSKWALNRGITTAANEGQSLADDEIRTSPFSYNASGRLTQSARDQLDRPRVAGQINRAMYGTEEPQPRNAVERYVGRVAEGFGANPVMGLVYPWATTAGEILGEGAADFNKWAGSPLPEWLARLSGGFIGGSATGLVPRARSWLGEMRDRILNPPQPSPPSLPLSSSTSVPAPSPDSPLTLDAGLSSPPNLADGAQNALRDSNPAGGPSPTSLAPGDDRFSTRAAGSLSAGSVPDRFYDMRDGFDAFLQNEAYAAGSPSAHNTAARDYVLRMGKKLNSELLVAYDAAKQEFTHVGSSFAKDAVGIPEDLVVDGANPDGRIIFHHNHPDNTGVSHEDLWLLALPGIRWIVAHGGQGGFSAARLTEEARHVFLNRDLDIHERSALFGSLRSLWRDAATPAKWPLQAAVNRGQLSLSKANEVLAEMTNRALERAGLVQYLSSYRVPSRAKFGDLQDQADEIARVGVQAIFPELKNHVPDPSPKPIRVDEGMARISGVGTEDAAERLDRALGGRVRDQGASGTRGDGAGSRATRPIFQPGALNHDLRSYDRKTFY